MFKYIYELIENVEIYPIVSLLIFFIFFVALILYVFFVDKGYIDKMKNIPLEDEEQPKLDSNELS